MDVLIVNFEFKKIVKTNYFLVLTKNKTVYTVFFVDGTGFWPTLKNCLNIFVLPFVGYSNPMDIYPFRAHLNLAQPIGSITNTVINLKKITK